MPPLDTHRRAIVSLHEFFVDWYTGVAAAEEFARLEAALGSGFEMVTPEGARRDRAEVLAAVRDQYDTLDTGAFDIEIRNVAQRWTDGEHALVRYEEWQEGTDGTTGRLSTVLFGEDADAPAGVVWLDLQETWLEAPGE